MVAFGLVAVCGFMNWGGNAETAETISFQLTAYEAEGASDWLFFIAGGISVGMWMYSGYESMSTIAGEVKNPQVIPKGTTYNYPSYNGGIYSSYYSRTWLIRPVG